MKEGRTTGWQTVDYIGGLPPLTPLSGRLFFCGDRVCIRFTEAKVENLTIPVCLELREDGERGTERWPGSTDDNVTIFAGGQAHTVKRFE